MCTINPVSKLKRNMRSKTIIVGQKRMMHRGTKGKPYPKITLYQALVNLFPLSAYRSGFHKSRIKYII